MKKTTIIILTLILLLSVGCTKVAANVNNGTITESHQNKQSEDTQEPVSEAIIAVGIISEIKEGMITLTSVKGLGAEETAVVLIGDETKWLAEKEDMQLGQTMTAELSPMMTRSLPPQSPAVSIISLENIIYGRVLEINEDSMVVKSENEYSYHEEVIIHFGEDTVWEIDKGEIKAGMIAQILPSDVMTMSIPPQTVAVRMISLQ